METSIGLISIALIIVFSYLSNLVTSKVSLPSVFLLLGLGVLTKVVLNEFHIQIPELSDAVSILGTVGLILIVLEAALEIEITRRNWTVVLKALVAAVGVIALTTTGFYVLFHLVMHIEANHALLFSIALSIMSSAIVIPSVESYQEDRKLFLTLEAAFSDVVGVIFFDFVHDNTQISLGSLGTYAGEIVLMLVLTFVAVFLITFLMQINQTKIKYFIILAMLLLLYGLGKYYHLPVLVLVLLFGIFLRNLHKTRKMGLGKMFAFERLGEEIKSFESLNNEISFIVRTFFFFIFGLVLNIDSLLSLDVMFYGGLALGLQYLSRFVVLAPVVRRGLFTTVLTSPRGLITILLFYSIPKRASEAPISDIFFFVIAASILIMTVTAIFSRKKKLPQAGPEV